MQKFLTTHCYLSLQSIQAEVNTGQCWFVFNILRLGIATIQLVSFI